MIQPSVKTMSMASSQMRKVEKALDQHTAIQEQKFHPLSIDWVIAFTQCSLSRGQQRSRVSLRASQLDWPIDFDV